MEPTFITITLLECSAHYGLSEADVREFIDLGLLQEAETPDAIHGEADDLARLSRLHHDLGMSKEAIDIIVAMRRRLVALQDALAQQTARAAQLERFLRGSGPIIEADF
ncbi:chaperone modulator CbpM [Hymenobacter cellulosilyticus]|uniref:Chaperone modulator CbpM n=1 Tax=Hymenobacter cellulosilyticus TaxID=2932248 RepID=A0A8T9Q6R8_9BACT|nr:chaperone modulator CbpM [Hymenobacter cellulosilyticus]UOQ73267.1 chaperone modulator CbpM [Hymenobacter cellulosilyticus]